MSVGQSLEKDLRFDLLFLLFVSKQRTDESSQPVRQKAKLPDHSIYSPGARFPNTHALVYSVWKRVFGRRSNSNLRMGLCAYWAGNAAENQTPIIR